MKMLILGIILCAMGLLHGGIKYFVIRGAARDVYDGGGVPVLDFAVFVPLWFAVGTSVLLKHSGLYAFPFFALVLYFVLAAVLYGVVRLEYRLGRPEIERQLAEIQKRKAAEPAAPADALPRAAER